MTDTFALCVARSGTKLPASHSTYWLTTLNAARRRAKDRRLLKVCHEHSLSCKIFFRLWTSFALAIFQNNKESEKIWMKSMKHR